MNRVLDPDWAVRSRGETRLQRVGRPCRGWTVLVIRRETGRWGSRDQPPAGTAEPGRQCLVDPKSLLRLQVDS